MRTGRKATDKEQATNQVDMVHEGLLSDGFVVDGVKVEALPEAERKALSYYTAEQVRTRRPETFATVKRLIVGGFGNLEIAKLLRVSKNTVQLIRECESLDLEKQRLAVLSSRVARLAFEGVAEDLSDPEKSAKLNALQKATIGAIATDKMQVLSGGVTSRVERVAVPVLSEDAYQAELARAMGSGARENGQKDATEASACAAGEPESTGEGVTLPRVLSGPKTASGEIVDITPTEAKGC